jgi:hypothetical protein
MKAHTYINEQFANTGNWQDRHKEAMIAPIRFEKAIRDMLRGWIEYAETHAKRYESTIGEDYALGPAWADIGKAMLTLLSGDLGRLDGSTLDGIIRDNLKEQGFNADE